MDSLESWCFLVYNENVGATNLQVLMMSPTSERTFYNLEGAFPPFFAKTGLLYLGPVFVFYVIIYLGGSKCSSKL